MSEVPDGYLRYSVSLVTQGDHRFYTLTMPSEVLARTCFVTTREEDPKKGFQRVLDKKRAEDIAGYIDTGFGTIPTSIVLSAQEDAQLSVIGRGKTLQFRDTPKAFLVLDGQHRVYGFSLAKNSLRVPVVVYNGLSRQDETRLFIDINTKQRPVPNELLLDIKRLADYETDTEQLLRELFDAFVGRSDSPLLGLMSPAHKASSKISRVTFNAALKPLMGSFGGANVDLIFAAVAAYLSAFIAGLRTLDAAQTITNATVFRTALSLFRDVAQRVKDLHNGAYDIDNFYEVLVPVFEKSKAATFTDPGQSQKELYADLVKKLKGDFKL